MSVQRAIASLAETFTQTRPDVTVVVGDDQREVFREDPTPSIAIHSGDSLHVVPPDMEDAADFRRAARWAEYGNEPMTYQCVPELAINVIESVIHREFDVAHLREVPRGRQIGHACNFVCRHIMGDHLTPYVPVLLNVPF